MTQSFCDPRDRTNTGQSIFTEAHGALAGFKKWGLQERADPPLPEEKLDSSAMEAFS